MNEFNGFGNTRGIEVDRVGGPEQRGLLNGYIVDLSCLNFTVAHWWDLMKLYSEFVVHPDVHILEARQAEFGGDLWHGSDYYVRALGVGLE